MNTFLLLLCFVATVNTEPIKYMRDLLKNNTHKTRRILDGKEVGETRPYMVYLRPGSSSDPNVQDNNWLCGGVIVHERYIITSAACIEDVKQFYVVSGMHRWVPASETSDECITYGAKKAIWKCVPKSYFFDGNEFDNIRWMIRDIAVVKVEDSFNFKRRVRGCDFIPSKIAYNNISEELEKAGTIGSIAGWGSTENFVDVLDVGRATVNSPELLEADVVLLSKKNCKNRWDPRYHSVIDEHMICAKDNMDMDSMSVLCTAQEVNCTELIYSDEDDQEETRRFVVNPKNTLVHTSAHGSIRETRRSKVSTGGFCENDHGGPLVVGRGTGAMVVGIISACQTFDLSHKCHGPFLYTSVYKNRHLINCAITKEMGSTCRRLLRATKTQVTETVFDWSIRSHNSSTTDVTDNVTRNNSNTVVTTKTTLV